MPHQVRKALQLLALIPPEENTRCLAYVLERAPELTRRNLSLSGNRRIIERVGNHAVAHGRAAFVV
jgi:hypothetical protein